MTDQIPSPCLDRIDARCFKAQPKWAKQAFAYRILHAIAPATVTKRLPRGLNRALLAPGVSLPPGVELPAGVTVGPGAEIPATWTTGDPLPAGAITQPSLSPQAQTGGASPPLYTEPFSPGPYTYYGRITPAGVEAWFYDDFTTLNPAIWTDYSFGTGTNSIDAGKLKMLSNGAGDYAYLETAADATIPAAFTWTFELTVDSGTGRMVFTLYTGVHAFWVIFDPPTTLRFRRAGALGYKNITVDNFLGTTDTWKFIYTGTTCDIYRDSTLIDSGLSIYAYTLKKGTRALSCEDVLTLHLDDYTITP